MIEDSRHSQTVKVVGRVKYLHTFKRTKLQNIVTIFKDKNRQKNVLTSASFWLLCFVVDQSDSEKKWGGPP